jgi:hypothetical protein
MLWMALMANQLKIAASQTIDLSAVIFVIRLSVAINLSLCQRFLTAPSQP